MVCEQGRRILGRLQQMMHEHCPFVQTFINARAQLEAATVESAIIFEENDKGGTMHPRVFNAPVGDRIGIIMPDGPDAEKHNHGRSLALRLRADADDDYGGMKFVPQLHQDYDPLQYVMLLPTGFTGYSNNIPHPTRPRCKLSPDLFYRFYCQQRRPYSAVVEYGSRTAV